MSVAIDTRIRELETRLDELRLVRALMADAANVANGVTLASVVAPTPSAAPTPSVTMPPSVPPLPKAPAGVVPGDDVARVVDLIRSQGPMSYGEIRKAMSWHGQVASPALQSAIAAGLLTRRDSSDRKYVATGS